MVYKPKGPMQNIVNICLPKSRCSLFIRILFKTKLEFIKPVYLVVNVTRFTYLQIKFDIKQELFPYSFNGKIA